MAAEFVGGALLGAVFGELLRAVSDAKDKAAMFRDLLEQLQSTLQYASPTIQKIEKLSYVLDLPKQETEELIKKLKQGEKLVHKCSTVKWNCFQRYRYAKKILKLDYSIVRYFQVDIQLQKTRDNKVMMVDLKEVHAMVKRFSAKKNIGVFNQIEIIEPCSAPDPPEITPGLDVPLEELKRDLFKTGVQIIIVSAAGGYGKTTLVKKLCKDNQVQGKFKDSIFFVTFSRAPNVKVIIQKIFQHKRNTVPEFQTDEEAINHLERLWKQIGPKPILFVLDDVWSGSESLLHKFKFQLPDYKILVTSRSTFPQFGSGHHLKPLNSEAARTLLHSAILQNGSSYIPNEDLVNKILRTCKGCPLALTVVGGSLRGQPAAIWRRRVKEWDQGVSIFHSNV